MDTFYGMLLGFSIGIFLIFALDKLFDHERRPKEDNIVWISRDNNLTCRPNKNYPKLNCELIKEAIGPKLNEKSTNKDEIIIGG